MAVSKSDVDVVVSVSLVKKGQKGKGKRSELSKGTVQLLKKVEETGSLRKASRGLKMAFSNTWHKISVVEKGFKVDLLKNHGRQGSTLTKEAEQLLAIYDAALAKAEKAIK